MERFRDFYLLSFGCESWNDNDEAVGIFTSKKSLIAGYYKLIQSKAKDIKENGFSMIDSLKISRFEVINDIIEEAPWRNEKSVKPEELGLPFVGDESTLEELEKLLSERAM